MSTLLKLRISADWPAQVTRCEWALYDANGRLAERGQSEPQHWPQADGCEIVLSADQCLALEATLPKGVKRHDPQVVAYAVEEHLVGDIHNEHVVPGETTADGRTVVWVVGRARLSGVLGALKQLGRTPQRAYSELQLTPLTADGWAVGLHGGQGHARLPSHAGFSFELAGTGAPAEVLLAIQSARAEGRLPREIAVHADADASFDAQAWHDALGVTVRKAGDYAWPAWPSRAATNLLVGEFTPPRSRNAGIAPFRPALAVGLATLALYAVFSLGEWAWLTQRAQHLRAQTTEVFRAAFPEVQTIVDPVLQMQRLYDPLMRSRGRVGESDFLPLLAAVTEALDAPAQYRGLAYEEGRLEFTLTLKDRRAPERLRAALARRGLMLTIQETQQTRSGFETSFSVRFGT
jgi:general secretion pathway protein L